MGISGLRVQRRLGFLLLALVFLAVFPGTGKAVKPLKPPVDVPKGFRQLEASVAGLRFFGTPTSQVVPMNARVYKTEFFKAETHYIWWEMCLNTKAKPDHPVSHDYVGHVATSRWHRALPIIGLYHPAQSTEAMSGGYLARRQARGLASRLLSGDDSNR